MKRLTNERGFTLIELLIVVAILGILGAILFVSIGTTPQRDARDARRIADINQLQLALELSKNANGVYPNNLQGLVTGGYIGGAPTDPKDGSAYLYAVDTAGSASFYHLGAKLEYNSNKALCSDADQAVQSGWVGNGPANGDFNGAGTSGPAVCNGASTGDGDNTGTNLAIYDVKS